MPVPPAFRDLVLVVAPLSVQLTSPSIGSVPLAFDCAQTSSILRNNYNLSSAAWSLPPTTKKPCRSLHHKFLEYLSPLICPFFRCPLMLQSFLIRILPPPLHQSCFCWGYYWPPCCKSQRKFFSPHLNLSTQSTTPSFLKHSLFLYSMIVCSFSQLLQSTLPSDKHSSGPGPGVNLLLWLHLLLNFNYSHISVSSQGFSLLCLGLASVSSPIACFMFYI